MTTYLLFTATADREAVWAWWVKSGVTVQGCEGNTKQKGLSEEKSGDAVAHLPREAGESLSLEESKSHEDVALRDVVIGYGGGGLGLVIWEVCLNLKDSVIPLLPSTQF